MKTNTKYHFLFLAFILSCSIPLHAQECVQCNGCTATGTNASAIGKKTTASGNNSFSGGYYSTASGSNSFAFGYNSKATQSTNIAMGNTAEASGIGSTAIGTYVKASAQNSFALGSGPTASYPLTNSTPYSIAFGVNSNKPTMLITKSLNNNYTGKVAIGQVTPQAKLHLKSDSNEDASVFIEPANKADWKAYIKLFDEYHGITVDKTATMELNSGSGMMSFLGDYYCFGGNSEIKARLYTKDNPSIYFNAMRNDGTENRDGEGASYAIDFNNSEIRFRTATYQNPRGSEITNWRNALFLSNDGKIGIGSKSTYLMNDADNQLNINSPKSISMQSSDITLTGKVGINTVNTVNGYALAVDGGIISTKVFIKEVNQWPDYVFSEDYRLMDLDELKTFLATHKHLPEVPSEAEVLNNGYNVNDMQQIMLKKIEEMTRYILLLQEEINALKSDKMTQRDSVIFTYDNNGNRVSRSLCFRRIVEPGHDPSTLSPAPYDLFPNPTSGQFSIIMKEPSQTGKLHAVLLTMTGVVIDEKDLNETQTSFDLSGQASGVYLLEIKGAEEHQSWKIIKQ